MTPQTHASTRRYSKLRFFADAQMESKRASERASERAVSCADSAVQVIMPSTIFQIAVRLQGAGTVEPYIASYRLPEGYVCTARRGCSAARILLNAFRIVLLQRPISNCRNHCRNATRRQIAFVGNSTFLYGWLYRIPFNSILLCSILFF